MTLSRVMQHRREDDVEKRLIRCSSDAKSCRCPFHVIGAIATRTREMVRELEANPPKTHVDHMLTQGFIRVAAWVAPLERLDDLRDFQPIVAASRSLLESAVDAQLLHHPAAPEDP